MIRVILVALLVGCSVVPPPRPSEVPGDAVYSGGPKGGYWLQCDEGEQLRECRVFHTTGSLYQSGDFTFLETLPECYPGFVLADYRFGGGFLIPSLVRFEGQNLFLAGVQGSENLESQIMDRYSDAYGLRPARVQIAQRDECENGSYEAGFDGIEHAIRGRIWAGAIFQVWDPRAGRPLNSEPLVLPPDGTRGDP
jgi:hypothetical protein